MLPNTFYGHAKQWCIVFYRKLTDNSVKAKGKVKKLAPCETDS